MERLETRNLGIGEERLAWEGLAVSCSPPLRRFGAFSLVGFAFFVAAMSAVTVAYNLFGERFIEGQGVAVPAAAIYATMISSLAFVACAYGIWLIRSLRSYNAFAGILRRGGLDPRRPTVGGLRAYSDEQILALRARYEKLHKPEQKALFERAFGFHGKDGFSLGPLSARPGEFEMNALRVEWEAHLILRAADPMPEVSWYTEGRMGLLPRQPNEIRQLSYALRYTGDSVRELKRRYGYRTDRWYATVPEGKLWDAVRDLEDVRRIQSALVRQGRG